MNNMRDGRRSLTLIDCLLLSIFYVCLTRQIILNPSHTYTVRGFGVLGILQKFTDTSAAQDRKLSIYTLQTILLIFMITKYGLK